MKIIYLWGSGKGRTPFQYNELSELAAEFEARNINLGNGCKLGDGSDITNHAGWLNKMLVKAEYMPHQIRITGIHCERLQDISDAECLKEGVRVEFARNGSPMYYYFDTKRWREVWFDTPREAFAALIDKVSGRGTWASNPWVVVYEFELVK